MPFVDKISPKPYKERMTLKKWHDDDDPTIDEPYETLVVEVWYDEYNNMITNFDRIQELEQQLS